MYALSQRSWPVASACVVMANLCVSCACIRPTQKPKVESLSLLCSPQTFSARLARDWRSKAKNQSGYAIAWVMGPFVAEFSCDLYTPRSGS